MRLTIDASNISNGGTLTHLTEILHTGAAVEHGFDRVTVWACAATLAALPAEPWLKRRTEPVLEQNFLRRAAWQRSRLGDLARADRSDLLFAPGGSFATDFRPVVTMSRNMLPFDLTQLRRFGLSPQTLRLLLLRVAHSRSYRSADGTIFLTEYAHREVTSRVGVLPGAVRIIPHGVNERFFDNPRAPRNLEDCTADAPFRMLYVSIVDAYKNQPQVAEAIVQMRAAGLPVAIDLIGPAYPPALRRLRRALHRIDPNQVVVRYLGPRPYAELHAAYARADAVLFASSCENMPNILLEGMASGLPIACSNKSSMPEILGDAGVYFDPESVASIVAALDPFVRSAPMRAALAQRSFARAQQHSWQRCADETFAFLAGVAQKQRASAR